MIWIVIILMGLLVAVTFIGLIWTHRPDVTITEIFKELLEMAAERIKK